MMPVMTPAKDLETKVLTLADEAKALKIVDQQSYQTAAESLLTVTELRHKIIAHHEPIKHKAREAWQAVIDAEKKMLNPVAEAERIYKAAIAAYEVEQRRLEAEARAKAEAEARRLAEEQRERELERAESEGADAEEIAAMIAAPLPVIRPTVEPAFQTARGISTAVNWKGEVTSLERLVKAIVAGKANLNLVVPNEPAINALARATHGTLEVPGVRFYSEPVVRARRR